MTSPIGFWRANLTLIVGVSPIANLPVPDSSYCMFWLIQKSSKWRSASRAEVGWVKTDSWATPTELNETWLAQAKELGYKLPAVAKRLARQCCSFRMVAVVLLDSTRIKFCIVLIHLLQWSYNRLFNTSNEQFEAS